MIDFSKSKISPPEGYACADHAPLHIMGYIVEHPLGYQIELKIKTTGDPQYNQYSKKIHKGFSDVVMIVATNGYRFKNVQEDISKDMNIRMSSNSAATYTFEQWEYLVAACKDAHSVLLRLKDGE